MSLPFLKNTNFLVSRRSDPPPALENAPASEVISPYDDYSPGFPCTSGCGQLFSTVIMQEIHVQHYCEGPYDDIEVWQGASVAVTPPPFDISVSNHNGIVRWLASVDTSYLESYPPSSPSPDAVAVNRNEDFTSGTSNLEPAPSSNPTISAVAVNHNKDFAWGKSNLEPDPLSNPTVDAVAVNHNEDFAWGTSNLEPDPLSNPIVNAVAVNHNKRFKCSLCGKSVSKQWVLDRHIMLHAAGKFTCPVNGCKYHTAKSQAELDFHLRVSHADITEQKGGARFTCWYCGRNMNNRGALIRHTRLHEAGKFPCPVDNCSSYVLLTQGALDHHLESKHTEDEISGSFL